MFLSLHLKNAEVRAASLKHLLKVTWLGGEQLGFQPEQSGSTVPALNHPATLPRKSVGGPVNICHPRPNSEVDSLTSNVNSMRM